MVKRAEWDCRILARRPRFAPAVRVIGRAGLVFAVTAALGLAALVCCGQRVEAQGTGGNDGDGSPVRHVVVTLFKSRTIKIEKAFATAVVSQPEIADVLPMTDSSIYIQGKKVGTTNVSIFDPRQRLIGVLDLEIVPDTTTLRSKIQASTGSGGIRVSSANGQVVLSGEASDSVSASRAVAVAKGLSPDSPVVNAMKVSQSQQVLLKVRFLEASREAGRELGVKWFASNRNGTRGANIGLGNTANSSFTNNVRADGTPTNGISLLGAAATFAGTAAGGGGAPFGTLLASLVNNGSTRIDVLLTALESKGLIKRLAEPDLIALSGDTASFLAGGEIPIPVAQSTSGGIPTVTVEFKKFGVELTFMPTVLANGLINLRLAPSVSEIDNTLAVTVNGITIPGLTKREARTTVELRDGQSFAIAGLLQSNNIEDISQLPWIGSIPVIGALFRSTSYLKRETDLVIIVTPHLVKPAAPGAYLATPFDQYLPGNDIDVFAMGQLERKKRFSDYVTSGGELKGPYGHIIQTGRTPDDYVVKK